MKDNPDLDRININRSDLIRLATMLTEALPDGVPVAYGAGWQACAQAVHEIARHMPDGCVLVKASVLDDEDGQ